MGQTSVQLPQVRQRSATSAKRGWSRLAASSSGRRAVSSCRPICSAASSVTLAAASRSSLVASITGKPREDLAPTLRPDLDEEAVPVLGELGEGEVEAALRTRARSHRRAEARAARLAAVDDDDEGPLATERVVALDVAALEEDAVLDRDRVQVAGSGTEEGQRPVGRRLLLDHRCRAVRRRGAPEADARGHELLLPRVRADRPAEDGVVVATLDPVGRRLVMRRPAVRQLVGGRDLVQHDRAVAHGRADHAIALLPQRVHEGAEPLGPHHVGVGVGSAEVGHGSFPSPA